MLIQYVVFIGGQFGVLSNPPIFVEKLDLIRQPHLPWILDPVSPVAPPAMRTS